MAAAPSPCWSARLPSSPTTSRRGSSARPGRWVSTARYSIGFRWLSPEGATPSASPSTFSNAFAPEHLQIHTEHPEQEVHEITAAGAVFLGEDVCTAYGDYIAGSNHVLPTAGTARFGSALSVENFLRKVAVISLIPAAIGELTPPLMEIARTEGLMAHARAAELRLEKFGLPTSEDED